MLKQLSIAEAKNLLDKTKLGMDAKRTEMQLVVGERYLGLIESADSISSMHKSSYKLSELLKEIPLGCDELRQSILSNVDEIPQPLSPMVESELPAQVKFYSKLHFLLEVPEQMWLAMDKGKPLEAMELYYKAKEIYESKEIQNHQVLQDYPFLSNQWACIDGFPSRICLSAIKCLGLRGSEQSIEAYGGSLVVLFTLKKYTIEELFQLFLTTRKEWITHAMNLDLSSIKEEKKRYPMIRKSFLIGLKTMSDTVLHVHSLFGLVQDDNKSRNHLMDVLDRARRSCCNTTSHVSEENMLQHFQDLDLTTKFTLWFEEQITLIHCTGAKLVDFITSPYTLASLQTCVNQVLTAPCSVNGSKEWEVACHGVILSSFRPRKRLKDGSLDLWSVLFEDMFVRRTGSLVQHSYSTIQYNLQESLLLELSQCSEITDSSTVDHPQPHHQKNDLEAILNIIRTFNSELKVLADSALVLDRHSSSSEVESSSVQVALGERCIWMIISLLGFFRSVQQDLEKSCSTTNRSNTTPSSSCNNNNNNILLLSDASTATGASTSTSSSIASSATLSRVIALTRKSLFLTRFSSAMAHATTCFPQLLLHSSCHSTTPLTESQIHQMDQVFNEFGPDFMPFDSLNEAIRKILPDVEDLVNYPSLEKISRDEFDLLVRMRNMENCFNQVQTCFEKYALYFASIWSKLSAKSPTQHLQNALTEEIWNLDDEFWRQLHGRWEQVTIKEEGEDGEEIEEVVFMPISESPYVGFYIMNLCCTLDHVAFQPDLVSMDESFLQTIASTHTYLAESLRKHAKELVYAIYQQLVHKENQLGDDSSSSSVTTNPYEAATLQLAFDLAFLRRILDGPTKEKLSDLFEKVKGRMDPVDWELYAPLLLERVDLQLQRSSLLYSILNGKNQHINNSIQNNNNHNVTSFSTGTTISRRESLLTLASTPVRFTMLPVPIQIMAKDMSKKTAETIRSMARSNDEKREIPPSYEDGQAFLTMAGKAGRSLMGQVGSNIRAASGSNLFASASSGAGNIFATASKTNLFASAQSYLRDGDSKN